MHQQNRAAHRIHHAAGQRIGGGGGKRIHAPDRAVEVGGFLRHRLFHQVKAGHNGAAQIVIVFSERINGHRRAAAHHHAGMAAETARAQGIKPAVGTMLGRVAVVVAYAQALRHGGQPLNRLRQLRRHQGFFGFAAHGAADDSADAV